MFKRKEIEISIIIPVLSAEYLPRCLKSLAEKQTHSDIIEVIIVDNSSNCQAKKATKECARLYRDNFPIRYFFYAECGTLEARRKGVNAAKGKYILNVDVDDTWIGNGFHFLFVKAESENIDILQFGAITSGLEHEMDVARLDYYRKCTEEYLQESLLGQNVFQKNFMEGNGTSFLWGKLIRRDIYLQALEKIPPTYCILTEDLLQYFFILLEASHYMGISECCYCYYIGEGDSTSSCIDSLEKWERICSASSAFTILLKFTKEQQELFPPDSPTSKLWKAREQKIYSQACTTAANSLKRLRHAVIPELQEESLRMLEDYWGKNFLSKVEAELEKK